MMGDPATYDTLDALKAEHRIHHYGVSIHEPYEGTLCLEAGKPEVLQVPFSLFRQEWIDELFAGARKAGVGIIAREPLGNGFLTGKIAPDARFPSGDIRHHWPPSMIAGRAMAAERFVLAFPEVSVAIPGAKTPAQVEENAAETPPLTDAEIQRARALHAKDFGL